MNFVCPSSGFFASFDLEWDIEVGLTVVPAGSEVTQIVAYVAGEEPYRSVFGELSDVNEFVGEQPGSPLLDPVAA